MHSITSSSILHLLRMFRALSWNSNWIASVHKIIVNALQTWSDANDSFAHRSTGIVIVLGSSVASTFTQNSSVLWNCALNASAWFTQFIHRFICRELIKRFISVAHWFLPLSLPPSPPPPFSFTILLYSMADSACYSIWFMFCRYAANRSKRTGNTLPWCWTDSSSGYSQ